MYLLFPLDGLYSDGLCLDTVFPGASAYGNGRFLVGPLAQYEEAFGFLLRFQSAADKQGGGLFFSPFSVSATVIAKTGLCYAG